MNRTAYLIAHTPRSGSAWLCDVLAKNNLGIPGPDRSALFIGYGAGIQEGWRDRLNAFFADNTNEAGLCGMKTDIAYLEHLSQHLPGLDYKADLFERFTHFIHLKREDVIEQAVSLYLAQHTGRWTSQDEAHSDTPQYDYTAIYKLTLRIHEENQRWDWICESLDMQPLVLTYEALTAKGGMTKAIRSICAHLGIAVPKKIDAGSDLEKLNNPLQAEFVEQFARGDQ